MSEKATPELVDNLRATEQAVLERHRGPAMVLLSKIKGFVLGDQQPVIKIRSGNRTTPAGPTTAAPVLHWSSGGYELSACVDEGQEALSIPLEVDHTNYYAGGKIADPATPNLHERSFSIALPFQKKKKIMAGEGEIYLGASAFGVYLKMHAKNGRLELEAGGKGAQIVIGIGAVLGAARLTDTVDMTSEFLAHYNLVTAGAMQALFTGTTIGTVSSASSKTVIE